MKLFLLSLLLLAASSRAQERIDGAYGINFGATREEVLGAAKAHQWKEVPDPGTSKLTYETSRNGVKELIAFSFNNKRVRNIVATFILADPSSTMAMYQDLVSSFSAMYGSSTPVREFSPPYSYGDARDVLQVKKGKASIEDFWQQPRGYNDVPSRDENGGVTWTWEELSGSIRTSITPHGDIQIAFSEEGTFFVLLPGGRK